MEEERIGVHVVIQQAVNSMENQPAGRRRLYASDKFAETSLVQQKRRRDDPIPAFAIAKYFIAGRADWTNCLIRLAEQVQRLE
jgi:hypothetical protein